MRMKRIEAGVYETLDGKFRVERDVTGKVTDEEREGIGVNAGCDDDGWCVVNVAREDVLDWFDTKREAVRFLDGMWSAYSGWLR
jgi:hypothetical protein